MPATAVAEARLELETNAPLWKDRKSSSCLQKISQACPARERSRRSRKLVLLCERSRPKSRKSHVQAFCRPEKRGSPPLDRPNARSHALGKCARSQSSKARDPQRSASATAAAEDQRTDSRPAQEETQRVESKKRARIQPVQDEAVLAAQACRKKANGSINGVHLGGTIALSLSKGSKSEIQGFESPVANLKEPVVSCASEIRIADASTSVESGATTACAHRVPSTVCESREHLRSDVCGSSNVALSEEAGRALRRYASNHHVLYCA